MSWLVLALISVFFLSLATLLQRVLMKNEVSQPIAYSIAFQFLCAIVVGIIAFGNGFVMPPIAQYPLNFLLGAMLYGLGTIVLFSALKVTEASEVTIISSFRVVVTIFGGVFLLQELFNFNKVLGTILILLAVLLISYKRKIKFHKGTYLSLLYAFFYGAAVVNDKFIINHAEPISYLMVGFILPGVFMMAIQPQAVKQLKVFFEPKLLGKMLIMCVVYALAAVTFYMALSVGANASQLGPINQSSVILTVILAALLLKERSDLWKKFLSAILVTVGVILLK